MHPDTRRRNYFPISVYAARANCLITLLLNVKQNALRGSYQGLSCIHSRCYANYRTSFGKLTLVCKPSQPLFIPWLLLHVCSAILIRSSLYLFFMFLVLSVQYRGINKKQDLNLCSLSRNLFTRFARRWNVCWKFKTVAKNILFVVLSFVFRETPTFMPATV